VAPEDTLCGDFHVDTTGKARFYPVWAHNTKWFRNNITVGPKGKPMPMDTVKLGVAIDDDAREMIMKSVPFGGTNFRCYMSGDPHLVASERRFKLPALTLADSLLWMKGGSDTTFTDSTQFGFWQRWSGDSGPVTAALNAIPAGTPSSGYAAQAIRLWPLHRSLNPNTHGVIHVHGPIVLSGVLRGSVTVYAATTGGQIGQVGYGDDLVYAQDPGAVTCANLLGVISDDDQLILDNAINSPQKSNGGFIYRWTDGDDNGMSTAHDFVLHGVTMSRQGTVGVENYGSHPEGLGPCNAANSGRGCIRQAGGVIEENITATYTNKGDGFGENRSVDVCLNTQSPPYFPTTGRYIDNRFYEIDPARYNITTLFQSMQGGY
jgi:hypothetical protein